MKNLILIIGTLLIALNTLIGLTVSDYATLNFLLADLSLALSVGLLYFVACGKMANGFKIGLSTLFFFTGLVRCLCVAFTPLVWANNLFILAAVGILLVELICFFVSLQISSNPIEQQ